MAFSFWGETSPTKVAIADLEKESKAPDKKWLEITDGHIFWLEKVTEFEVKKKAGNEEKTVKGYYVPLVSKSVLETWEAELRESGTKNAKYPYAKARVFLK